MKRLINKIRRTITAVAFYVCLLFVMMILYPFLVVIDRALQQWIEQMVEEDD